MRLIQKTSASYFCDSAMSFNKTADPYDRSGISEMVFYVRSKAVRPAAVWPTLESLDNQPVMGEMSVRVAPPAVDLFKWRVFVRCAARDYAIRTWPDKPVLQFVADYTNRVMHVVVSPLKDEKKKKQRHTVP